MALYNFFLHLQNCRKARLQHHAVTGDIMALLLLLVLEVLLLLLLDS
jgi:hypothetical protein